jgi:hypothetical protein
MTDVAMALRISHVMFDGLSPRSVSLNTRDGSGTHEEHGAVIERKRDTRSTIWLNGMALHNIFDDDKYAKPAEHPNLLVVGPRIDIYSKSQRGDTVSLTFFFFFLSTHLYQKKKHTHTAAKSAKEVCAEERNAKN